MKAWLKSVDKAADDMNPFLMVFAVGLFFLCLTVMTTRDIVSHIPQVTRVVYIDEAPYAGP